MTEAKLEYVSLHVDPDKDIYAVSHWDDGSKSIQFGLGFWSGLCLCWRYMRQGVDVQIEDVTH